MRDNWAKVFPQVLPEGIRQFATAIGDHNPIHHDEEAAMASGLKGIVAHGVMIMGYLSATIAEEIPGVMILRIKSRFERPLYAGVSPVVLCTKMRERKRFAYVNFEMHNGTEERYALGSCALLLPSQH